METNVLLLLLKIQIENQLVLVGLGIVTLSIDLHLYKDKVSTDDYLTLLAFMRSKKDVTERNFQLKSSNGFCHTFYFNGEGFLNIYRS